MNNSDAVLDAGPDAQPSGGQSHLQSASPGAAFAGELEATKVSFAYKVGLAVVAFVMVLLVAAYLALIVFTAYGVYYHLRHHSWLFNGGSALNLVAYLGPAVAGATLVFFMVKPYFAGERKAAPKYSLTPQSDPKLFEVIARICELVKAPLPTRVDVDCQINASASFRRGIKSLGGNDVVLTIGLPLVAGLTMQEFAGVLAHEFGHFAQGAGMRLTYIIRQTSGWFGRVVYERDQWDVALARAAYRIDLRIGIFLHLTRFCIWVSRRVLWVLMYIGHGASCFMLRQMEYDADSYETKLAGSAAFARTTEKVRNLVTASQWAYGKIEEGWRSRRLPEDLPGYLALSPLTIPAETRQKIEEGLVKKRTRFFDTHPCDSDRVKAATVLKQQGIFHVNEPAAHLFNNFSELSKAVTRFHYENNLELKITEHNLVAHEVTARESQSQAEGEEAMRKFFFGLKLVYRPVVLSFERQSPGSSVQPELFSAPGGSKDEAGSESQDKGSDLIEQLKRARQEMERAKPEVQTALSEYESAEWLYQRGLDAVLQSTQQATAKAAATMERLIPKLEDFEKHAQVRLGCALGLLYETEFAEKIRDVAVLRREAEQLAPVFTRLCRAFGPLQELRRKSVAWEAAFQARNLPKLAPRADARIGELAPELQRLVKEIRATLEGVLYPFHHPREDITLEEFARNDIPAANKTAALYNDCFCYISRLIPLYHRVLGRLTYIALAVEQQV